MTQSAILIDGKAVAASIRQELKEQVSRMKEQGVHPGLAVILVGNDPASETYVRGKVRACGEVGIYSELIRLPESVSEEELLEHVHRLNGDARIHGILVQLPLPKHISEEKVIDAIVPEKDVDGFHPISVGNLVIGKPGFLPCTPHGIMELLRRYEIPLAGKHAVVIGRSNIVGKPVSLLLQRENATVTMCHSKTVDLPSVARQADILIAAVGKPHLVTREYVKPGAVVIDVGINRTPEGKLVGDVHFEQVREVASYITPVPGGVGPMTIAMLLVNTVQSARRLLD
ncbi:bifunctional methylenetetrahydrofolate dehydrogenase/methenyltetrahydrofolate cyclohydrolase FolD [Polycladomyces subterraneus]|uniref:Bifunctional protein FolD n=1 Tax=Polycladomyces subterraneus TaxID=1016997 RepID=A0ABT8IMU6_9BACL|nr:bifunctional methylenetetrahydrofolate dehydrogenase/methenyltetrahydrofolate cyclohydrolase FolD [Polycladomyces subterraneus]MDN4594073.1 bifunctional methylenetetrahydrofolate dehydrogenase/methenyltetrahydrofolate cyclohydrolase FolD [Polycladomyces subterraneus]